jgi:iturin family lipopeptide synthetase B
MVSRVHKELKVRVPLEKVFHLPTVRELAEYIRGLEVYNHVSIEAVEKKEYYPLSPAQKRLYILQQMEPEDIHYNMSAAYLLEGEPDRQKLETAFNALVNRHESLRTSFQLVNDGPVQKIHRHVEFTLTPYPLALTPQFSRPFDLSRAPLLRVGLAELAEQRHLLMVDMHHIISDGTSSGVLVRDFMRLYAGEALAPLKIQYKDFSQWQNELLTGTEIKSQESYWLRQFEGEIPVLNLPVDFARPTVQSFDGSVFPFEIEPAETAALKRLASRQDATLYILLLAIFNILLARLSGQEDIVVGSPVAGRRHADLEPVIGMFVNTLAMRNTPAAGKSFQAFLKETGERALAAFENQDYPFEDLVEKVVVKRDAGRNPLFDVMFVFQNMEQTGLELPGLVLKPRDYENRRSKFDLNLEGVEKHDRLCFSLEYNTKLFRESTVRRLAGYFQRVVKGVIANPAVLSADVEIIHEKERRQILDMSMGNREAVDPAETIHRMFEKKAGVVGDRAALVFGDSTLSYRELNKRSHQLAVLLHAGGVGIDSIVGLMVERSLEMIVGMLAIMKAGGAYLPIDPEYPKARKQYMIRDSRLKWLLTNYRVPDVPGLIPAGVEVIDLRDDGIYRGSERVILPGQGNKGSDLAYVIYTSGSTGMPKGVMLEHRNLVNLFIFQFKCTALDCSRMLQFATISFDASFHEIFSALLSGGTLCLVDRETRANVADLFKVVEKNDVKTVFFPMSFLKLVFSEDDFISHFPRSITHIQTAGEQVIVSDKFRRYLKEKSIPLHNHYGPSETHVVTTLTLDPAGEIPVRPSIGKPILNTGIYILDKREHLVPVGVPGELYIGGIQVGRGYLDKPGLTAEKFNRSYKSYRTYISYKTGDLARWLEDGNIEFLGRIDHQVKIRGFRVELGEIESRLLKHPSIKDAVVTAGEDERGDKYLCAYITARGTEVEAGPGLKEYLSCSLPDYMVPSYFIMLDKIPLSPAGKVDRAALPAPGIERTGIDYIAPRDRVERKLVELWSELLGVAEDRIGIDDNFFRLGGHSLKATVLLAKIHKVFQVKMTLAKLFARPSVRGTADNIKRGGGVGLGFVSHAAIEPAEKREYYELSSAQLRFYMIQQMDPGSISYNLPALLELEGEVDKERFRRTFQQLIKRHESLRTSFIQVNEEPVQRIHEQENYKFRIKEMIQNFVRPFDLSQAPLLRVGLVKVETGKHLLMLDMHHIITDGTSLDIFIKEFMQLYEGKEPAPVRIQYKDFSRWQNNLFRSGGIKKQEEYWLTQFPPGEDVPVLNLPVDYPRPAVRTFEGADVKQVLDKTETEALKKLAREKEVTLSMMLFALFNILLAKLGDQEDIVVGQTVSGRRHADLQGVVGMFINILAMRNFPRGEKPFGDFLKEVKERTLEGFENQDYPFEKLVERAALNRGSGRNPLFDVEFVMQVEHKNLRDLRGLSVTAIPGLTVKSRPLEKPMSNFDLFLYAEEVEEGILLSLQYWTKLFRGETARDFLNYYLGIVKQVIRHPGIKIGDIDIMDEAERDKMLSIIRENKETVDIDFEF